MNHHSNLFNLLAQNTYSLIVPNWSSSNKQSAWALPGIFIIWNILMKSPWCLHFFPEQSFQFTFYLLKHFIKYPYTKQTGENLNNLIAELKKKVAMTIFNSRYCRLRGNFWAPFLIPFIHEIVLKERKPPTNEQIIMTLHIAEPYYNLSKEGPASKINFILIKRQRNSLACIQHLKIIWGNYFVIYPTMCHLALLLLGWQGHLKKLSTKI